MNYVKRGKEMIHNDLQFPIEELGLSVRSYNVLKRNKIDNVGQLLNLTREDLLGFKNLGSKSLDEIWGIIEKIREEYKTKSRKKEQEKIDRENEVGSSAYTRFELDFLKRNKVTILNHVDDETIVRGVQAVWFYDKNRTLVDDLIIEDLGLSNRAYGALSRNEILTAKKIIEMKYDELCELKSMGQNTISDIITRLKEVTHVIYSDEVIDSSIDCVANVIIEDIYNSRSNLRKDNLEMMVRGLVFANRGLLTSDTTNVLENKELMNEIYSSKVILKKFEKYIGSLLRDYTTLSLFKLKQKMPLGLQNSDVFMQIINDMTSRGKIDYTESGLQYHFTTLSDCLKLMTDENAKTALLYRLQGLTLEEAAQHMGITRERVRQLANKAIGKMPRIREDDFKYWFETYDITKEEFMNIFCLNEESYYYLRGTYKKGKKLLEEIFEDQQITGPIAQRAAKEMEKYCVIIAGEYVPIKRDLIVKKLMAANFSDKDCHVTEFYELFFKFLEENGLSENEKLTYPSERAFGARLDDQRYSLSKYGKRYRYYDMVEYDLDDLFASLHLEIYNDMEISTSKLVVSNPELMEEYHIFDEYELHNLMKKNEDKLAKYNVKLGRMPLLSIGNANREEQVIDLLLRLAPIELNDYANAYQEKYGVNSATVMANFVQVINEYYENGMFSLDYPAMTQTEYQILNGKLVEDFYFIEDIEKTYIESVPSAKVEKINSYNLKVMGFMVYTDYVVRNTYQNAYAYFKNWFIEKTFIDLNVVDKRITYNQEFSFVLEELRVNFDILEYEKNKYISYDRFSKGAPDITKEDLKKFAIDAAEFTQEQFFTIKSIRKAGFVSKIDDIGFDDYFYSALLRSNKAIRYNKVGGTFLFAHMDRQFKFIEFVEYLMKRFRNISVQKLLDIIFDEYGIKYDRADLISRVNNTGMYYDRIMEKVYINKEEYYEDI